jgi:hypothetical protein
MEPGIQTVGGGLLCGIPLISGAAERTRKELSIRIEEMKEELNFLARVRQITWRVWQK